MLLAIIMLLISVLILMVSVFVTGIRLLKERDWISAMLLFGAVCLLLAVVFIIFGL